MIKEIFCRDYSSRTHVFSEGIAVCRMNMVWVSIIWLTVCLPQPKFKPAFTASAHLKKLRAKLNSLAVSQLSRVCHRASDNEQCVEDLSRLAAGANTFPIQLASMLNTQSRSTSQLYGLFTTTCGAALLISSCALTFWICAACSFRLAVRA